VCQRAGTGTQLAICEPPGLRARHCWHLLRGAGAAAPPEQAPQRSALLVCKKKIRGRESIRIPEYPGKGKEKKVKVKVKVKVKEKKKKEKRKNKK
jgi:hypothetical protein